LSGVWEIQTKKKITALRGKKKIEHMRHQARTFHAYQFGRQKGKERRQRQEKEKRAQARNKQGTKSLFGPTLWKIHEKRSSSTK